MREKVREREKGIYREIESNGVEIDLHNLTGRAAFCSICPSNWKEGRRKKEGGIGGRSSLSQHNYRLLPPRLLVWHINNTHSTARIAHRAHRAHRGLHSINTILKGFHPSKSILWPSLSVLMPRSKTNRTHRTHSTDRTNSIKYS